MEPFDVLIIGAGPAGLAAAVQSQQLGLRAALVDEQAAPGGQIYRAIEAAQAQGRAGRLGTDYRHGMALLQAFRSCGASYFPNSQVWRVDADGSMYLTDGSGSRCLRGRRIIAAVGAMERPVPIRGWTLPGVMTVGAGQIMLKTADLVPRHGVWLAGSGPLLLAYAVQVLASGGQLAGILDTTNRGHRFAALAHAWGALRGWRYLLKGVHYYRQLRKAGIRIVSGVEDLEACGQDQLSRVRWLVGGRWQEADAEQLLLHEGVIPSTHLTRSLECEHRWDDLQQCLRPVLDDFGRTSLANVFVAGDCGSIGGARVAEESGRLAALGVHVSLQDSAGSPEIRHLERRIRRRRAAHLAIRGFLDTLFAPPARLLAPADEVMVCRCEGVTAGQIRQAVSLGCRGPAQVKSFTRCGMGPCQGRLCGPTLTTTVADALHLPPQDVGGLRIRPPLKSLQLGELADLAAAKSP